jgi:hypothetical protein
MQSTHRLRIFGVASHLSLPWFTWPGGGSWCNVVRRDRIRVVLGGRVIWRPFNEAEVAAKLLVELAERSEARTRPSVRLGEVVLRREPEVSIG